MRKFIVLGVLAAAIAGAAYFGFVRRGQAAAGDPAQNMSAGGPGQQGRGGRGGRGGDMGGGGGPMGGGGFGGRGGGFRPPMTVEVAKVARGTITASITVVGNLIGKTTVDVVPRTGGRLMSINVQLGDRVRRGQVIAKIEDREIVEQLNQAQASHQVAEATIRQREADLNLAQTNVERSRNLFNRQLLPRQTLDDSEARYTAAVAQVDVSRAQLAQSEARIQELKINLSNTNVLSPVDGFVAKRNMDPGAWASQNAPVVSVVDISSLRLVANVVERDLKAVDPGDSAIVEVDAFPGEKFSGRIARVSPILDPATRTAAMEVEVPNRDARLKPGMYARVDLEVENKPNVLVVPKIALVDSEGRRGVFIPSEDNKATFREVKVGVENNERAEIIEGLREGDVIVGAGAGALRREDSLVIAGAGGGRRGPGGPGGRGMDRGGRGGSQPGSDARFNRGNQPGGREGGSGGFKRPDGQQPEGQRPPQSQSLGAAKQPIA